MNEKPLNVLAVMNRALNQACGIAADHPRSNNLNNHVDGLREARAAVNELMEAAAAVVERGTDSPEHNRLLAAIARCGGAA